MTNHLGAWSDEQIQTILEKYIGLKFTKISSLVGNEFQQPLPSLLHLLLCWHKIEVCFAIMIKNTFIIIQVHVMVTPHIGKTYHPLSYYDITYKKFQNKKTA